MKENQPKESLRQLIDRWFQSLGPSFLAMIATQTGAVPPQSVLKEIEKQSK